MHRKKTLEVIEEYTPPKALIISASTVSSHLADSLSEYGCQVEQAVDVEKISGRYDYIFQFDQTTSVEKVVIHHLKTTGKFLLIITNQTTPSKFTAPPARNYVSAGSVAGGPSVKILKVGEMKRWDIKELVEKIFKTMFSSSSVKIIDVWKGERFIVKETLPSYSSRERTQVSESRDSRQAPLEVGQARTIGKEIPPIPPLHVQKTYYKKRLFLVSTVLLVLIFLFSTYVYWYVVSVKKIFSNFQTHFITADYDGVASDLREAKMKLKLAQTAYDIAYKILIPLRETSPMQETGSLLLTANNLLTLGEEVQLTLTNKQTLFFSSSFAGSKQKIETLTQTVVEAQRRLKVTSLPFFPKKSFGSFLESFVEKLASIYRVLPLVERLLTNDKVSTYILLFQNNMELRATGGFIGSLGLVTLEKGKLVEFKILDVYDADGQLKGHVEPPKAIRKYLSQPNFFLRDSNFDPDFAVSASLASWFLQKELGISSDGVIGVNLFFVQNLLRIFGPLAISDFNNEIVSFDNFFFKAQSFTQKDFFPGSTQKKDFLKAVANNLQIKILTSKNVPLFELFTEVRNALERKNILLYAFDPTLQKLIEEKGWGGRMVDVACVAQSSTEGDVLDTKSCLPDYLSIIETNFGVNKANYFVNKSVAIEKKIDRGGQIVNLVTLSYENKNIPEIFSGGTYVNYLRVFVPLKSVLLGVTLNNVPIAPAEIDVENYGIDKTVFAFLVKVAPDNKAVVRVSYKLTHGLSADNSSYQFFYQKQAGDKNAPLLLSITKPTDFKLQPLNFNSTSSRQEEVFYATDTSVDRIFAFSRN